MTSSKRQKRTILITGIIAIILFLTFWIGKDISFETTWRYEKYNDGYRLISYTQAFNDNKTEIVIPDKYEGKNVIAIDDKAFYKNKKIKSVVIPDTVTEMGASVFKECSKLEKIEFGKNILTIGGECFKDCKSLKEAILPEGITEIRGEAFMGCSSLETVVLPIKITEIKGNTFENCSSLVGIEIPNGVTRIAAHAFYGCSSLSYVFVPDTVNEIGSSAFRKCDSLQVIELPQNVSVNERAFKESPTDIKTKQFTDKQMEEIKNEAYDDFDIYALYNLKQGKDKIFCFYENTIVITTSEKFKEKYFKSNDTNKTNDLFELETSEDFKNYIKKAKNEGVTKVIFYAYSEKASEQVGEPYFLVSELGIDDFENSLTFNDEE